MSAEIVSPYSVLAGDLPDSLHMNHIWSTPGRHTGGVSWVDPGEHNRRSLGQASAGGPEPMDEQGALDVPMNLARDAAPSGLAKGGLGGAQRPSTRAHKPQATTRHQQRAQTRPGDPQLDLRLNPGRARAAASFDYFALGIPAEAIDELAPRLTAQGKDHGGMLARTARRTTVSVGVRFARHLCSLCQTYERGWRHAPIRDHFGRSADGGPRRRPVVPAWSLQSPR